MAARALASAAAALAAPLLPPPLAARLAAASAAAPLLPLLPLLLLLLAAAAAAAAACVRWWRAATLDLYKVGPFLRLRAAHKVAVLVADPAAAQEVLSRSGAHRVPRKVPEYACFDLATGLHGHHSILTEQDEERWVAVRKALAPAYGAAAIRDNWPHIVNSYRTMAARIAAAIETAAAETAADEDGAAEAAAAAAAAEGAAAKPAARPARPVGTATAGGGSDTDESSSGAEGAAAGGGARREGGGGGGAAAVAGVKASGRRRGGPAGGGAGGGFGGFGGQRGFGADVQIDHLALGASIQLQAEGLFRMPPAALAGIDDLQARALGAACMGFLPLWLTRIASDLETVIGAVHAYGVAPWERLLHFWLPWATRTGRRMHPARRRLAAAFEAILRHVEAGPPPGPRDVTLSACLRRLRDPQTAAPPPRPRLLAEVGNQIMAPETAAHTLSWALFCVATHPEAEARLLAEFSAAGLPVGAGAGAALAALEARGPEGASAQNLPFLAAVLNESMRMFPAGASASPRCFKPERWLACIGGALGMVAVTTAAAALLCAFSFRLSDRMGSAAGVAARTKLALTLKVEGGTWLRAAPRRAPAAGA
ncbi:hypothetical protein Rsub_03485 [Raphidocelis subcapitata]|uniref:Cytochrome P450 n=1 Tax=Raphidocelis subcapitata TaxID=307507 RepID=A0A2V0NT51_9CHLO|nr:hypothetical protein Rsub_03485 [Raphidocelis subcapitata]|eukprot:GBF90489.1 hypothetical protein Rsub_03485 [Raphidocelis subcapitata]